jgi:hypothetical protein
VTDRVEAMREGDYVDCKADWQDAGLPLEQSAVAA